MRRSIWRMTSPMAAMAALSWGLPTALSLTASPFPIEMNAVYQPSFGEQYVPDTAFGDGVYLSVWTDLRTGGATGLGHDLYGQITTADGVHLFEGSLVMQRDFDVVVGYPRVAWNGTHFLVIWAESLSTVRTIKALRVVSDGTILDASPILVYSGPPSGISYDVASDGNAFLVVYAIQNNIPSVGGVRVAPDGAVIDHTPLEIRAVGGDPFFLQHPRVAFGSGTYVVVWLEDEFTRACRVTPTGAVLDSGGVQLTGFPALWGDIASDGVDFMVAWTELDDPSASNAGGGILDPDTMTIDTFHNLTDVSVDGPSGPGALAFDGERYLVLIYTPEPTNSLLRDLYGIFVDFTGAPTGSKFPIELRQGADQGAGGLGFDGVNYFAAWEDSRDGSSGGYTIYGKFIPADGGPVSLSAEVISPGASWQIASATAFDGTNYMVVWEDWRKGPFNGYKSELYAARVTPDGVVLDDPAFLVADDPNREKAPQMVFDGEQYFVVYEYGGWSTNVIRAARILPDGTVLDPDGFTIAEPIPNGTLIRPQVAFNGQKYLVVFHNNYGTASSTGVVGVLVGTDGTVETPTPISIATQSFVGNTSFAVDSDGQDFLVTWTVPNNGGDLLKATRVGNDGQVLGTTLLSTSPMFLEHSRIAYNGDSYLVVWSQGIPSIATVQAVRVAPTGQPVGGVMNLETQTYPHVDVVAYHDTFVIPYYKEAADPPGYYLTQLAADGSFIVDGALVHAVPFDDLYRLGSIAAGSGDHLLQCFSLWADMPYNAPRMSATLLDFGGSVIPGDADADGDVDLFDFAAYLQCTTGPGGGVTPACHTFDFDADGDVDFADHAALQIAFTGM